jgi:hypothetical protein
MKELSGESLFVIISTDCVKKVILCPRGNDVEHISEEFLTVLTKGLKFTQLYIL